MKTGDSIIVREFTSPDRQNERDDNGEFKMDVDSSRDQSALLHQQMFGSDVSRDVSYNNHKPRGDNTFTYHTLVPNDKSDKKQEQTSFMNTIGTADRRQMNVTQLSIRKLFG